MKKLLLFAAAILAVTFIGCNEQDEPAPVVPTPTLEITASGVTVDSITFTITTTNADECAYILYDYEAPTADAIFSKGTAVETNKAVTVTVSDLKDNKAYKVAAAVKGGEKVEVKTLEMTTAEKEAPTVMVEAGEVSVTSISFTITPANAEKCTYVVLAPGDEIPTTDEILMNGTDVAYNAASEHTIKHLTPETTYTVIAAVRAGVTRVASEPVEITTDKQEQQQKPNESNCVIKASASNNTFELKVYELDGKTFIATVNMGAPSAFINIIPEADYHFDGNASYNSELYDYWFNSKDIYSGTLSVKHLSEGYEILIQGTGRGDAPINYLYSGIVEPINKSSVIANPPVPYDDNTYSPAVNSITGSHYQPGTYFDLNLVCDGGYVFGITLITPETVNDAIIPEGKYTLGGEYELSEYSTVTYHYDPTDAAAEFAFVFQEDSYVEITHLDGGYKVSVNVVNALRTRFDFVYEGLILKDENASYNFENPGYTYPATYSVVFTKAGKAGANYAGNGYCYAFNNEYGDTLKICFNDSKASADGIEPGTYVIINSFDDWVPAYDPSAFQICGNDSPMVLVDYPNPYPFYPSPGICKVSKEGDVYTIDFRAYVYYSGYDGYDGPVGHLIMEASYTGTL